MDLVKDIDHDNDCRMHDATHESLERPSECNCGAVYRHFMVPQRLYESEINFSISCFWDGGFDVKLGDQMNGWEAEANVDTYPEAMTWLDQQARKRYPESFYATGKYPPGWMADNEISGRG